ncbi:rhodanese-like domain-containing protein [Mycobacterium asiaticum]|uniref:Sulfurtransferase n=1 Tax=Mycobacterium asiaticum TaxID=1790 RepID=A0A1A3KNH1_MYCAS|nr:rhodanese-like domain-containing protein [Mycobacterium asiaticum]OBI98972.1 sulfurtransferase [Mycobacterium asiaticum]OBJ85506.1 sulfurtransferase [Mycobacterium asiaticum]
MNTPAGATISPAELDKLLDSSSPPRVLDVRTPAEYETAHIAGSHNVPLDVLRARRSEIAEQLKQEEVVLVCKSGQRAARAGELLRGAGVPSGRVLENGITGWQGDGRAVDRGRQRWELERQVRLVAGSIVLSSVLGSVALPKLKWLAAAIGGGLTFAAVTDTCAMASALSKLPYNRGADADADTVVAKLGGGTSVA